MTSKDYLVGVPINSKSVTPKFLDFINADIEIIGILTGGISAITNRLEYNSCSFGYDLLLQNNFSFVKVNKINLSTLEKARRLIISLDNVWIDPETGGKRWPLDVARTTCDLMRYLREMYPKKHIARFCPGSPYKSDRVTLEMLNMMPLMEVIPCKSACQLAYEELVESGIAKNIPPSFITLGDKNFSGLLYNKVNLMDCMFSWYMGEDTLELLQSKIDPSDEIYTVHVSNNSKIKRIANDEVRQVYLQVPNSEPFVLAVVKN